MKHLLSSTAFIVLNKELARQVGLKEAVLLADLISKEEYFIANGMTDGWFFNTEANIYKDTTLTAYQQRNALKTLRKHQIIETKRKGVPARQYFKINEANLLVLISCEETKQLVVKKVNNLSSSNLTTINKNKEIRITNNIISNREAFVLEVMAFDYDKKILEGFIDYWTEPNKSKTKMKFELNKTWETNLRLKNWSANQKKWDAPTKINKNKLTKNTNTMKNVLNKINGYD
tara:strand:+ start:933 stop:1628 length:696 start_codon:yes stop_codon:yes gene_type:complete